MAISHNRTFEWLFDPQKTKFSSWLEDTGDYNPIFLIRGKAGSGKSTLMKFAMRHETTQRLLNRSSIPSWTFIGFFFHDRGSATQKSLSTMLQELLYQTLSKHPCLAVYVQPFYDMLMKAQRTTSPDWDFETLRTALIGIMKQQKYTIRICYFVDALDEHAGDNDQLATLLYDITSSVDIKHTKIKICLASRPWNVFITHFGRCPGFAIHDYTRDDISIYTSTRLYQSLEGQDVRKLDKETSLLLQRLVDRITKRAQGVFIWVRLVVDDLAPNVRDGTPFSSLEDKLSRLPPELNNLYLHTLTKVNDDYMKETHAMLQIVLCSAQPLSLECVVGCTFYATLGRRYVPDTQEAMVRSLQSRSGGLLEVVPSRPPTPPSDADIPDTATQAITLATFQQVPSTSSDDSTGGPLKAESTESFTSTSDTDGTEAISQAMKRSSSQQGSISTISADLSGEAIIELPDRYSHLVVQFIHQTAKEFISDYRPDMAHHEDPDWFKLPGQFFLLRSCGLLHNRWADSIRGNIFIYANQIDDCKVPGPDGWPLSACWIRDVFEQLLTAETTGLNWLLKNIPSLPHVIRKCKNFIIAFSGVMAKDTALSVWLGIAANLCNYIYVILIEWQQCSTLPGRLGALDALLRFAVLGPKTVPGHKGRERIANLLLGQPLIHSFLEHPSRYTEQSFWQPMWAGSILATLLDGKSDDFGFAQDFSENERLVLARILLTHGADVEYELPVSRGRPLLHSVRYEKGEMVRLLLQHGADPSATTDINISVDRGSYYKSRFDKDVNRATGKIRVPTLVYALLRRDLGVLQALNDFGGSLRSSDNGEPSVSNAIGRAGVLAVALCGPGSPTRKDLGPGDD